MIAFAEHMRTLSEALRRRHRECPVNIWRQSLLLARKRSLESANRFIRCTANQQREAIVHDLATAQTHAPRIFTEGDSCVRAATPVVSDCLGSNAALKWRRRFDRCNGAQSRATAASRERGGDDSVVVATRPAYADAEEILNASASRRDQPATFERGNVGKNAPVRWPAYYATSCSRRLWATGVMPRHRWTAKDRIWIATAGTTQAGRARCECGTRNLQAGRCVPRGNRVVPCLDLHLSLTLKAGIRAGTAGLRDIAASIVTDCRFVRRLMGQRSW